MKALPPLAREIVQSSAAAFGVIGSVVVFQAIGPVSAPMLVIGIVAASSVTCFGGLFAMDPIAFLSIVVPPISLAIVGAVTSGRIAAINALIAAWMIAWSFLAAAIWPWWTRVVLRRMRLGTPEGEVKAAYRRLYQLAETEKSWWNWDAWTKEMGGIERWRTPRTSPLISALDSIQHLWAVAAESDSLRRAMGRLGQEFRRMSEPPRLWIFRRRGAADPSMRSTARTSLEYEYPRLEALLAEATPDERHRMGIEAARMALDASDLLTPARQAVLERAGVGPAPQDVIASVAEDHDQIRDVWMALEAERTGEMDPSELVALRRSRALSSLSCAISPLDWPLDETDALYEAACSLPDVRDATPLEEMAVGVLGPERSGQAQMIAAPEWPPAGTPGRGSGTTNAWPAIATLPRGWRGIGQVILLGLVAESIAVIVENIAWPIYAGGSNALSMDRVVYAIVAWLTSYVIVRVWAGRPSLIDGLLLFLASAFATGWFTPVFLFAHDVINPVAPGLWVSLFQPWPHVLPYAVFDGIALAMVLVVVSYGLRAIRSVVERAPATLIPGHESSGAKV